MGVFSRTWDIMRATRHINKISVFLVYPLGELVAIRVFTTRFFVQIDRCSPRIPKIKLGGIVFVLSYKSSIKSLSL
jgi:hypothetical protein